MTISSIKHNQFFWCRWSTFVFLRGIAFYFCLLPSFLSRNLRFNWSFHCVHCANGILLLLIGWRLIHNIACQRERNKDTLDVCVCVSWFGRCHKFNYTNLTAENAKINSRTMNRTARMRPFYLVFINSRIVRYEEGGSTYSTYFIRLFTGFESTKKIKPK